MECGAPIKIVGPVNLIQNNHKFGNASFAKLFLKVRRLISYAGKYTKENIVIHWPYKESMSEQPPSDHIDKLASMQSVHQKYDITSVTRISGMQPYAKLFKIYA